MPMAIGPFQTSLGAFLFQIPEEHDLESQIRKEREWRFLRNTRVRQQARQLIQKGKLPPPRARGKAGRTGPPPGWPPGALGALIHSVPREAPAPAGLSASEPRALPFPERKGQPHQPRALPGTRD